MKNDTPLRRGARRHPPNLTAKIVGCDLPATHFGIEFDTAKAGVSLPGFILINSPRRNAEALRDLAHIFSVFNSPCSWMHGRNMNQEFYFVKPFLNYGFLSQNLEPCMMKHG